jgi:hypothetical protein
LRQLFLVIQATPSHRNTSNQKQREVFSNEQD